MDIIQIKSVIQLKKLIKEKVDIKIIISATWLSKEEIEKLEKEMNWSLEINLFYQFL